MNEQAEACLEREFEIFWQQHNPDDWVAEVVDRLTGERRHVYNLAELAALLHPPHRSEVSPSIEPRR